MSLAPYLFGQNIHLAIRSFYLLVVRSLYNHCRLLAALTIVITDLPSRLRWTCIGAASWCVWPLLFTHLPNTRLSRTYL